MQHDHICSRLFDLWQILTSGHFMYYWQLTFDAPSPGKYSCVRSNEAGEAEGSAWLTVLVRTQIIQPPADTKVRFSKGRLFRMFVCILIWQLACWAPLYMIWQLARLAPWYMIWQLSRVAPSYDGYLAKRLPQFFTLFSDKGWNNFSDQNCTEERILREWSLRPLIIQSKPSKINFAFIHRVRKNIIFYLWECKDFTYSNYDIYFYLSAF